MGVIFSYSLYGTNRRYIEPLLNQDLSRIQKNLGQKCRFLLSCNTDVPKDDLEVLQEHGYELTVTNFVENGIGGMFARYRPILETVGDAIFVRDTDCILSDFECNLLKFWLESEYDFHIIRGHPLHIYPVMGGLFGLRRSAIEIFKKEYSSLTQKGLSTFKYNADQIFLAERIYPRVLDKILVHSVRVVYKGEKFIHYVSPPNFIGETILNDEKRTHEKSLTAKQKRIFELPAWVAPLSVQRPINRLLTLLSLLK